MMGILDYYNSCESTEDAILDDFFSGEIFRRLERVADHSDLKDKLLKFKVAFEEGTSLQGSLVSMIISILGGDELSADTIPPQVCNEFNKLNEFISFYPNNLLMSRREDLELINELKEKINLLEYQLSETAKSISELSGRLIMPKEESLEPIQELEGMNHSLKKDLSKARAQISDLSAEIAKLKEENERLKQVNEAHSFTGIFKSEGGFSWYYLKGNNIKPEFSIDKIRKHDPYFESDGWRLPYKKELNVLLQKGLISRYDVCFCPGPNKKLCYYENGEVVSLYNKSNLMTILVRKIKQ